MLLDETIYLLNDGSAAPAYKMNYGTHTIPDSQFAVNNEDPTDLSLLLSEGIYAHDLHYVHRINGDLFFNIIIDDSYYRLMSTAGELHTVVDDILGIDSFVFEMNAKEYIGVMDTAAILFMLEYGEGTPFKKKLDSTGLSIDENSNPLMIRYWN